MSSRTSIRSSSELTRDLVSGASQVCSIETNLRDDRDRLLQSDEIARPGIAKRHACQKALEILYAFQAFAELRTIDAAERKLLDGIQSVPDALERDERPQQPGPQESAGHGSHRAIDFVKQRPIASAVDRLDDLEVFQRDGVNQQTIGRRLERNGADMGQVGLLGVAKIVQQGARGRGRRWVAFEPESLEAAGPALLDHAPSARIRIQRSRRPLG